MTKNKDVGPEKKGLENRKTRAQELADAYMALPAEDRRSRLLVMPYYSQKRDEILEPDNVVQQFRYFWDQWVPRLGPVASMLYMKLRQYCYYNRRTGEVRDYCFPKQSTLGEVIGVKDKKTVRKALVLLEQHGLIRRESQYRYDQKQGKRVRTTDVYHVAITDILTPEDSVTVLLDDVKDVVTEEDTPRGIFSPQVIQKPVEPVDNSRPKGNISPHIGGGENPSQEEVLIRSKNNVTNVRFKKTSSGLQDHPVVKAMNEQERASKESLVLEIGDRLLAMGGQSSLDPHKSAGFHRRVAFLMPTALVYEAIAATRDAFENERSGRTTIPKGLDAYFGGIVRRIAEREGIDIGVEWKAQTAPESR